MSCRSKENGSRSRADRELTLLITAATVVLAAVVPCRASQVTGALQANQEYDRNLAPGEQHRYPIALGLAADPAVAEYYLRIEVEQRGVDVALILTAEDGTTVAEVNGPAGARAREILSLVTSRGRYRLTVAAAASATVAGSYRLTVAEMRPSRVADNLRVEAEVALHLAGHLTELPSQESKLEAKVMLEASLVQWSRIGDAAGTARALQQLGDTLLELYESHDAVEVLQRALELQQQAGDRAGKADTLTFLGKAKKGLGEMDEARWYYQQALAVAEELGSGEALACNNLGNLLVELAEYEAALGLFRRALELVKTTGNVSGTLAVMTNIGKTNRKLGDYDDALATYNEALCLARDTGSVEEEAHLHNNLGVIHRGRGELQEAIEAYTKAHELAMMLDDRKLEGTADLNLAKLLGILGEKEQALERFTRALELFSALEAPHWEAKAQMRLGQFYESQKELEKAIREYKDGLPKSRRAEDRLTEGQLLQGMGRAALRRGLVPIALVHLRKAHTLLVSIGNLPAEQAVLRDLAEAHLVSGDLEAAADALQQTLDSSLHRQDSQGEIASRSLLARLERTRGDLPAALEQSLQVLDGIEELRLELADLDFRASFLSQWQEEYAGAVDILMTLHRSHPDQGYDRQAFAVAERSRARTLLELLTESRLDVRAGITPDLQQLRSSTTGRLTYLQLALADGEGTEERRAELRGELDQVKRRLKEIERKIRRQHPRYAEIHYPQPLGVGDIQPLLGDDRALLMYLLGERFSCLFVVTGEGLWVQQLPSAAVVLGTVARLRSAIEQPLQRSFERFTRSSRALYRLLVQPAEPHLAGVRTLVVVPDRGLSSLPFATLLREDPGAGKPPAYLLERWSVAYAPSATVLARLADARMTAAGDIGSDRRSFVAFADPELISVAGASRGDRAGGRALPGARREVQAIAELFAPSTVSLFLGAEASERALKRSDHVEKARWLHIASHGLVDPEQPAYSALLLSPDRQGSREDGLLQVHEVLGLKIDAELVVLSACDTGLGKEVRGEGVVGLTQAFLHAGAESVVVSLWQVADRSTADLMVHFYRALQQGSSKAEALRRAKLAMLCNTDTAHPFYWAPFVLVGASS